MKNILIILSLLICTTYGQDFFKVEEIVPPKELALEVGGMCLDGKGGVMITTRRGEVWNYNKGNWKIFASGLQEPLGIRPGNVPGEWYVLQRPELTRLLDEDGDGSADLYSFFARGWGFTGNYHSFAMAFTKDKEGNFYGGLGLPFSQKGKFQGRWLGTLKSVDRGIYFKIDKDGNYSQFASGVREPVGSTINDKGEIFITDTQGSFTCTNWVMHVEKGDFVGHPEGLLWDKSRPGVAAKLLKLPLKERNAELNKMRKRPVVYLPYRKLGVSVGGLTFDTSKGKFGPYAGQLIIAECIRPVLLRAFIEKVDGVYQGAAFKLSDKVGRGGLRPVFAEDGSLWLGKTARGWGRGLGLSKVSWNGKVPFDIKEIKIAKDGFDFIFTKPTAKFEAADLIVSSTVYEYTNRYKAEMQQGKNLTVSAIELAADGLSAHLKIADLAADTVVYFNYKKLRSQKGEATKFGETWYTLNKLKK